MKGIEMAVAEAQETKPEVVTKKSMELPPKIIALLRACRSNEQSRYAIRHAFVIDGSIYTTTGRIAASITPPAKDAKLADGTYLIVGNEIYMPAEFSGSYPKANEVFLGDEHKMEPIADCETGLLRAIIEHKIHVNLFKFAAAFKALNALELSDCHLYMKKNNLAYPIMLAGHYVHRTGDRHCVSKLRSAISEPYRVRVVAMTYEPNKD